MRTWRGYDDSDDDGEDRQYRASGTTVWQRPVDGRLLAGVCAALSDGLGAQVAFVRFAFALLVLAKGAGLALYLLLWLLLPDEAAPRATAGLTDLRDATLERLAGVFAWVRDVTAPIWDGVRRLHDGWRPAEGSRGTVGVLVLAVGATIVCASFGLFGWLTLSRAVGLALLAVGAGMIMKLRSEASE